MFVFAIGSEQTESVLRSEPYSQARFLHRPALSTVQRSKIFGNQSKTGSMPVVDHLKAVIVTPNQLRGTLTPAFLTNSLRE
jgi:hypothetical protein